MNIFQILDCSTSMKTLIGAVDFVLTLVRWAIPVVLIILGSIDMFKAMASNDEKKAGEARKTFIRRLIYAVVAFLIPFLVTFAFDIAGQVITNNDNLNNDNLRNGNFFECWYKGGSSNNKTQVNNDYDDDTYSCWKLVDNDVDHMQPFSSDSDHCPGCWGTYDSCHEYYSK